MNKAQGLPHGDAAAILKQGFHLQMSRSGICRAIQRVARKAEATWHALRDAARRSPLAHMDETGWKVEAQLHWLWAVVTEQITYCQILPGRGFAEAAAILGAEYAGWLIHDGLQIYYKFLKAAHQSCAAHLIRRCRDLIQVSTPTAARFPRAVQEILEQGLTLRDRYLAQKITLHGLWTATGRLEAELDRLLDKTYQDPANRRLAKHLRHERPYLFTFLYCPGLVDATNNLAERVMRILVMIRKNWGGNRTENGARSAGDPHQRAMHCPAAGQRCIPIVGGPAAVPATETAGHPACGTHCGSGIHSGGFCYSQRAGKDIGTGRGCSGQAAVPRRRRYPPIAGVAVFTRKSVFLQFRVGQDMLAYVAIIGCWFGHEYSFRGDILRAELHVAGSGVDACGGAGLRRFGSDRDRQNRV